MLVEIIALVLVSLLQVTLVPLDLVLLILVCRSLLVSNDSNFYLAFAFGLLISIMQGQPMGVNSLIYLGSVQMVAIIQRSEFSTYWLAVFPITFVVFLDHFMHNNFYKPSELIV